MKVLVATSDVPFVEGGHRVIARALVKALIDAGHSAELLTTPQNRFGRQFSAYTATRLIDVERTGLEESIDRLISIRFPSYALKHPHHVCWLNHRMREYYDLWDSWTSQLSWKGKIKESIRRQLIHSADSYFLKRNVRKVFAQSRTVQRSLKTWGNIDSEVLYPPPPLNGYFTEDYGDFILSPSRLSPLKRVPLLIQALAQTSKSIKAVIVGDGVDSQKVCDLVQGNGLQDRVLYRGYVEENELRRLYATCRAVYYAPVNEDFGLVTMEAFHSRKPVITTIDSGGPTELVQDGVSGFVVEPEVQPIARVISTLFEDSSAASRMGQSGFEAWKTVTWPATISRLLE